MPTMAEAEPHRASIRDVLAGAGAALMLLTRIPVPAWAGSGHAWSWAVAWFPLVGVLVGAVSAAAWWAVAPIGALPAGVLAVIVSIVITGALHEDGLADTADALGGARDREAIFEILKDSRVGTYGAVAIGLSLLWRVSLLFSFDSHVPGALVLSHTIARLMPVWLLAALPYVTPSAAKSAQVARAGWSRVAIATIVAGTVAFMLVLAGMLSLAVVAGTFIVASLATLMLARWFLRRAGGLTGDFLGATEQVGECLALFVAAWLLGP